MDGGLAPGPGAPRPAPPAARPRVDGGVLPAHRQGDLPDRAAVLPLGDPLRAPGLRLPVGPRRDGRTSTRASPRAAHLRAALDGRTPFRQPGAERTVRGRSWALHDGVGRWGGVKMFKLVGPLGRRRHVPRRRVLSPDPGLYWRRGAQAEAPPRAGAQAHAAKAAEGRGAEDRVPAPHKASPPGRGGVMAERTCCLVHYHEISLKRGNRPLFLRLLQQNLARAVADLGSLHRRPAAGPSRRGRARRRRRGRGARAPGAGRRGRQRRARHPHGVEHGGPRARGGPRPGRAAVRHVPHHGAAGVQDLSAHVGRPQPRPRRARAGVAPRRARRPAPRRGGRARRGAARPRPSCYAERHAGPGRAAGRRRAAPWSPSCRAASTRRSRPGA